MTNFAKSAVIMFIRLYCNCNQKLQHASTGKLLCALSVLLHPNSVVVFDSLCGNFCLFFFFSATIRDQEGRVETVNCAFNQHCTPH